jgi:hypothetical protein
MASIDHQTGTHHGVLRCGDCGATAPSGSAFCDHCGHALVEVPTSGSAVPDPAATDGPALAPPMPPPMPPPEVPTVPPVSGSTTPVTAPDDTAVAPTSAHPGRRRWLLLAAAVITVLAAAGVGSTFVLRGGADVEPTTVQIEDLMAGDCLLAPADHAQSPARQRRFWEDGYGFASTFDVVPCHQPHGAEVFFVGAAWAADATYPGDDAASEGFWSTCEAEFRALVGLPAARAGFGLNGWLPVRETWDWGDRDIICFAYDSAGEDLTSSVADAR